MKWGRTNPEFHDVVIGLEQQLAGAQKALAEQIAVADDLRHHLHLAREEAIRAEALRLDALRTAEDRTRLVGVFNGRIEAIHKLTARMPPEVAVLVRAHTRPEEVNR